MAAQNAPRAAQIHENLQESLLAASSGNSRRAHRPNRPDPAPRIVPQQPRVHRPGLILGLLFAPFSIGYKLATTLFRMVFYVLNFLPRPMRPTAVTNGISTGFRSTNERRMLMPRDTAARFKREFEEEYGTHELPFFEGGVAQALDLAKKDLKFLLLVLMSPEHDDTESFVRQTLLSPSVVDFIKDPANNIILWGGNVLDSEAYQVSMEYSCTKFPFSALVCLTPKEGSTRMSIIKRLVGPMTPSAYLSEIQNVIEKYAVDLAGVRAERTAQEVARSLRTEQDSAYERSLARDRERARQKKEAAAAALEAERKAKAEAEAAELLAEKREQWRRWKSTTIGPEPPATAKDVVRIALKFPESTGVGRIIRRFSATTPMEELYAFVDCYEFLEASGSTETGVAAAPPEDYKHEYSFRIASLMPRQEYDPNEDATMGQKIGRSGNLIVEEAAEHSESEESEESEEEE
jgi:FAS-associated factor 2